MPSMDTAYDYIWLSGNRHDLFQEIPHVAADLTKTLTMWFDVPITSRNEIKYVQRVWVLYEEGRKHALLFSSTLDRAWSHDWLIHKLQVCCLNIIDVSASMQTCDLQDQKTYDTHGVHEHPLFLIASTIVGETKLRIFLPWLRRSVWYQYSTK